MAQDLPLLCSRLAEVLAVVAGAPVGVVVYTYLTVQVR
jgi:hypothetical protein